MSELNKIRMLLTHAQMVRALKGLPIHLSPSQITEQQNTMYGLVLGLKNLDALKKARRTKRGVRITLDDDEKEASKQWANEIAGKGLTGGKVDWKKVGRFLKKSYGYIKPGLTEAYKSGLIEKGLTGLATTGTVALGTFLGQPEIVASAPVAGKIIGKIGSEAGHKMGAYGIKSRVKSMDTPKRKYPITTKPINRKPIGMKQSKAPVVIALPPSSGKGIKSDLKKLGKKLHKVAKPLIKQVAHKGVKELVKMAAPIIPDKLEKPAERLALKGTDMLAQKVGAYGMSRGGYGMYRGDARGMYRGRGEGMRSGKGRTGYGVGKGFAR